MNALSCIGCAGPTIEADRPLRGGLGAMSSDAVIGAVLAGGLLVAVFALTANKKRGVLKGIFGRSRRRRRR